MRVVRLKQRSESKESDIGLGEKGQGDLCFCTLVLYVHFFPIFYLSPLDPNCTQNNVKSKRSAGAQKGKKPTLDC